MVDASGHLCSLWCCIEGESYFTWSWSLGCLSIHSAPACLCLGPKSCMWRKGRNQLTSRFCFTAALLPHASAIWPHNLLSLIEHSPVKQQRCGTCESGNKEHGNEAPNCHPPKRCSSSSTPHWYFQPEIFGLQVFGFLMNSPDFLQKADTFFLGKNILTKSSFPLKNKWQWKIFNL